MSTYRIPDHFEHFELQITLSTYFIPNLSAGISTVIQTWSLSEGPDVQVGGDKIRAHRETYMCHIRWEHMLERKVKLGKRDIEMSRKERSAIFSRGSAKSSLWR